MQINPRQYLRKKVFYNNLMLIMCIFSVLSFITSFVLNCSLSSEDKAGIIGRPEGTLFGPIVVEKQPKIFDIKSNFYSDNSNVYVSGEVLDGDKDTLFEFGKELWHESGYDSDGYWSESDRVMKARLSFTEPGTYYINFKTEGNNIAEPSFSVHEAKASEIPHFIFAIYLLLIVSIWFTFCNFEWIKEKYVVLNEKLEEASEEDD